MRSWGNEKRLGKASDTKYVLWNSDSHRGVSTKGRALVIKHYLCVDIRVRCINLNIVRLSDYQDELHDSGLVYRRIAYWLNENQYKTPRGNEFKNNHVHSILKKRRIRNERIKRPYELTFREWYIKEV